MAPLVINRRDRAIERHEREDSQPPMFAQLLPCPPAKAAPVRAGPVWRQGSTRPVSGAQAGNRHILSDAERLELVGAGRQVEKLGHIFGHRVRQFDLGVRG